MSFPPSNPSLSKNLRVGGVIAGSDLRTQRRAVKPPTIEENLCWNFLEIFGGEYLSGPWLHRFGKVFKKSPPTIPSKIHGEMRGKIRGKSADKVRCKIQGFPKGDFCEGGKISIIGVVRAQVAMINSASNPC